MRARISPASFKKNRRAILETSIAVSESLALTEERLRVLAQHSAENRICVLLEQLLNRSGRQRRETRVFRHLQLTHAELAEHAGLSRAHVSVVMARLRKQGYVCYDRRTPLLVNVAAVIERNKARSGASKGR